MLIKKVQAKLKVLLDYSNSFCIIFSSTPQHGDCLQKKKKTVEEMEIKLHTGLERYSKIIIIIIISILNCWVIIPLLVSYISYIPV